MCRRILLAVAVVLSGSSMFVGPSTAQQVVCNPHCSPAYEDHRGQGLRNANDVAGEHGFEGRDNARQKQDAHRPGGSGVPDPNPPAPPPADVPPPPLPPGPTDMTSCSLC